ncbi:hypothetical protein D9V96_020420 [Zobellia laminariae]|uniref:hypothetical protein n=1 Tax=Zobellia laminariae TaxID=248906 RepID=UPI0012D8E6E4|nr:hypothetical protein [Zobellia laminariae]
MEDNTNIFGCFVSGPSFNYDDSDVIKDLGKLKGKEFREYIWGLKGISNTLKELKHKDYGKDLKMILFQFNINPIQYLRAGLKDIESYRKNEKSVGVPIIIDDENFFNKNEEQRFECLMESINNKMDLIEKMVKNKKLDTNINLLRTDLKRVMENILLF